MAIPVLKLNLAPPPTLWRRQHAALGWTVLGLGILTLGLAVAYTWNAYRQASRMGQGASRLSLQTQQAKARQATILADLRAINVQKELPRWRLAERILSERSSPWSRLTAELERSSVQDVRVRALQRSRGSDQQVVAKVKGEARTRAAETAFVEAIQKNAFFAQLILERESERQGGGVDFEYTLLLAPIPPPYSPLPKFGPSRAPAEPPKAEPAPVKVVTAKPKPLPTPAPAPKPMNAPPLTPRLSVAQPQASTPDRAQPHMRPWRGLDRPARGEDGEARRIPESDRNLRERRP